MADSANPVIQFIVPDKILDYSEATLQNKSREQILSELKLAYDRYVSSLETQAAAYKENATSEEEQNKIKLAFDDAMQRLGKIYNDQLDAIIAFYQEQVQQNQNNQNRGNVVNRFMELRNTPGYQNYVVGTEKTIDGVVGSSVYKKYYSDISAELYFNGHWFEDISAVQWQIQRQTYPLFGYNSFIYDDVALGNRIIYGAFSINFTEPNRLNDVIAKSKVNAQESIDTASYEKISQTVSQTTVNVQGQQTKIEINPAHAAIWSPRFDIDIVFGESDVLKSTVILPKHIILWDCHLMGSQISMATNDGVLQESYQFLARDFKVIK